jgi:hypothetical protein
MLTTTQAYALVAFMLCVNAGMLALTVRSLRQVRRISRTAAMLRVIQGGR